MAAASRNEFKLIGPVDTEKYNRSVVTLTCRLSPKISADNLEIRWFKETDCVCVYKNRQVTEGSHYVGRVSLFTQELERENVSLKLKDCKESDLGHYLCQVTDGNRTEEITVAVWPRTPPKKDDQCLYVCQRDREWTEDERMKMKISASQIDHLRDRFERMGLEFRRHSLSDPFLRHLIPWDLFPRGLLERCRRELEEECRRREEELRNVLRPVSLPDDDEVLHPFLPDLSLLDLSPRRPVSPRHPFPRRPVSLPKPVSPRDLSPSLRSLLEPRKRRNSTDGDRPNMSGEYPTEDFPVEKTLQKTD